MADQETFNLESADDIALADRMNAGRKAIITELGKRIIGQNEVIELVLQTLFVGGNSIIIGVPGLAKTLLVQTLAHVLDLKFTRIQFTPDPDAVRHHGNRHHPGGHLDRPPADGVRARTDFQQHRARR